jgi:transcriptional regulator with XRE-family HTH domain
LNDLSDRIRLMRRAQKLSQTRLAEKIGVTQPYIAEIEKGRKTPSVEVLEKLCGALGCSADYLLGITKRKQNGVLKEENLSAELEGSGLSVEILREVFERNISESDLKLALRVAKVIQDEKRND